jgi:precorrin-2 dehydrogenase/sirohydrochlorin ferrochelatase
VGSSFASSAVLRRGGISISVSTNGAAPALAKAIRKDLGCRYGREYGTFGQLLGKLREKLLTQNGSNTYNRQIFKDLASSNIPHLIKIGAFADVDAILNEKLGSGITMADLGFRKEVSS